MLTITEYPHGGEPRVWTADDEEDFCCRVVYENPQADRNASFDDLVEWMRAGLLDLVIVENDE